MARNVDFFERYGFAHAILSEVSLPLINNPFPATLFYDPTGKVPSQTSLEFSKIWAGFSVLF